MKPHPMKSHGPALALLGVVVVALAVNAFGAPFAPEGAAQAWVSLAVGVTVQALPFLVLGVALSALVTVFIPQAALLRVVPRRQALAVPTAALSGMALPACECASVPVANSLMRKGVPDQAALAFMLASPAINPIVLVSTAVAFAGQWEMVWARFAASLLAACVVGWVWRGSGARVCDQGHHHGGVGRADAVRATFLHDFISSAGFLAIGAMITATIKVLVPASWLRTVADNFWLAVLLMIVLAIVLALCSEADAFIAASFTFVPPVAQLVFLVVGPVVDTKLIAMQYGAWGGRFVIRFVPLVLVVAVVTALVVGWVVF